MGGNRSDDEDDEDCDENDGDKFWCGLRTISERVLQVLLEKRTTTYKQVSDMITNDEAQKLSFLEAGEEGGNKKILAQKELNRKRIKNLRRRVYDSLNVLLACGIFTKERKKVTFNMDYYEFLPDQLKAMLDDISDEDEAMVVPAPRKEADKTVAHDATVTEEITVSPGEDDELKKEVVNADEHLETIMATLSNTEDRVKTKMAKLQDVVEQTVQLKRLIKRNMKIEKSIKKRFWSQNMDVSFENQRCTIPFILVKM